MDYELWLIISSNSFIFFNYSSIALTYIILVLKKYRYWIPILIPVTTVIPEIDIKIENEIEKNQYASINRTELRKTDIRNWNQNRKK